MAGRKRMARRYPHRSTAVVATTAAMIAAATHMPTTAAMPATTVATSAAAMSPAAMAAEHNGWGKSNDADRHEAHQQATSGVESMDGSHDVTRRGTH